MRPDAVRFDAVDLARQIETLSQYQLDTLPFGVILIDRDGTIVFYSRTEARQSGRKGAGDRQAAGQFRGDRYAATGRTGRTGGARRAEKISRHS